MKKKIPYILISLLVIMQVYSISKINDLQRQISNINYTVYDDIDGIYTNIGTIYSEVEDMLKEQASIIHFASISIGKLDIDTLTVPVIFKVEPKKVTDSMSVSLKFSDKTTLLSKEDTIYSCTKVLDLTNDEIFPTIIIEDEGIKIITEDSTLCVYNLASELIPRLYTHSPFGPDITKKPNSDIVEYHQAGELFIDGKYECFKNAQYVTYIDGKKTNEITIDLSKLNMNASIFPSDEILTLEKGQIITTYVVALDNLGFTHHYPLERYEVGSDEQHEPYYDIVRVTAPNGKIIYDSTGNGKYAEEYGYDVEIVYP